MRLTFYRTTNLLYVKALFLLLIFFINIQLKANMAEPLVPGTIFSRPFVSQFVDITHEDIFIKIDEQFNTASFEITYHINALCDGIKIPLLFYAADYEDGFTISIDGVPVQLLEIPYDYRITDTTKFHDFSYFFSQRKDEEKEKMKMIDNNNSGFYVALKGMKYFETDILKGEHIIKVSYTAQKWIDSRDWINEYSFRYALSPAKYWKSFGTLSIVIDAAAFNDSIATSLGNPTKGNLATVAKWELSSLPAEILAITFKPKINKTAATLIRIDPLNLAYMVGFVLMLLHIISVRFYRIKNPTKKYSWVVIVGSIIVPFVFFYSWVSFYVLIDNIIGEYASGKHGYLGLQFILYPVVLPFYLIIMWLVDRLIKKRVAVSKL